MARLELAAARVMIEQRMVNLNCGKMESPLSPAPAESQPTTVQKLTKGEGHDGARGAVWINYRAREAK